MNQKEVLKDFAEKKLCSITTLAKLSGVHRVTIHRILSGKITVEKETWKKIYTVIKKYRRVM